MKIIKINDSNLEKAEKMVKNDFDFPHLVTCIRKFMLECKDTYEECIKLEGNCSPIEFTVNWNETNYPETFDNYYKIHYLSKIILKITIDDETVTFQYSVIRNPDFEFFIHDLDIDYGKLNLRYKFEYITCEELYNELASKEKYDFWTALVYLATRPDLFEYEDDEYEN